MISVVRSLCLTLRAHCELNPVELCWAKGKAFVRQNQTTESRRKFAELVKEAMSEQVLEKDMQRRFIGRARRYLGVYQFADKIGVVMKLVESASHRRPKKNDLGIMVERLLERGRLMGGPNIIEYLRSCCDCDECMQVKVALFSENLFESIINRDVMISTDCTTT